MNGVVGLLTLARNHAHLAVTGFGIGRDGASCPSGNPDSRLIGQHILNDRSGAWVVLVSPLEERCPCAVALFLLESR